MVGDLLTYPVLIIDGADGRVDITSKDLDGRLRTWFLRPSGPDAIVLVDAQGKMFEIKLLAVREPGMRSSFWGNKRMPLEGYGPSYDYDLIETGQVSWSDLLEMICKEFEGKLGQAMLDYPGEDSEEIAEEQANIRACTDINQLCEILNIAPVPGDAADVLRQLHKSEGLNRQRVFIVLVGLAIFTMFCVWVTHWREWIGLVLVLIGAAVLVVQIMMVKSDLYLPFNNRRVSADVGGN